MGWNPFGQQSNPNPGFDPNAGTPGYQAAHPMGPPIYNPPAVQAQTNQYGYTTGNAGQTGSNPGGSLPGSLGRPAVPTTPGAGLGANVAAYMGQQQQGQAAAGGAYMADPTSYGGAVGGPQQWTNYYQGLGATAAGQVGDQRAAAMNNANASMAPYQALGQAGAGQWNAGAGQAQGMGNLAQGQLAAAGAGQDQVSKMFQAQANGTGPNAAASTLGQGAAAGIHAQLAAAASTRGGAAMQAAAGQGAALQNAGITGQAAGNAANMTAQAQLQGQQNLAQYTQGAQTGLAGAANSQLNTTGNLGLGYGGLGQTSAAAGLQANTQAGEAYSAEQLQAQQAYEQMAQQVQANQLQAQISARGQNMSLQGQQMQIQSANNNALIGGALNAAGAVGQIAAAGIKSGNNNGQAQPDPTLSSDENLKTGITGQGSGSPGDGAVSTDAAPVGGLTASQLRSALAYYRGAPQGAQPMGEQPLPPMQSGAITSDERAKTNVSPAPTADALLQMLAKSKATYTYKNPADQPVGPQHPRDPNARFGGVMAQDLERVPEIGRQLVTDTPHGKIIEPASGLSAVMMGLGRLHERLSALEGSRR